MTKTSLLILDDEPEVLNALKRTLRSEFELFLFSDPIRALEFYRENPVPLVLSDMRMPVMDGATFLTLVSKINPRSKRFLLTGHSDIDLTVTAVNDGKISHYFTKPWDNKTLIEQFHKSVQEYVSELKSLKSLKQMKVNHDKNIELELLNSLMEEAELKHHQQVLRLKKNFNVFIEIYADSIALHTQDLSGHNYRIGSQARYLALQLGCNPLEAFRVYVAGLLYETGKLSLPQSLLEQPFDKLSAQQQMSYNLFYEQSCTLLARVGQLNDVVKIIEQIPQPFNRSEQTGSDDLTLGARILAVLIAFDNMVLGRKMANHTSVTQARTLLEQQSPSHFDPLIVKLFFDMLDAKPVSEDPHLEFAIDLSHLGPNLVLTKDIENTQHGVLLTQGTALTERLIEQLHKVSRDQQQPMVLFVKPVAEPIKDVVTSKR